MRGTTLNPPARTNAEPSPTIPLRLQVFPDAKVTHVDAGLGLLLRLPMEPEPAAAFVHVSNLADDKLSAAEVAKKFKVSFMSCAVW